MIKMSLAEFNKLKNNGKINLTENKQQKYRSQCVLIDGIRFDSKREANYYSRLKLAESNGELLYFLRQVPIHLDGGVKYRVDFLEFWRDGTVRYVDVKGFKTREYLLKKKLIEAKYPIKIIEM